MSIHTINAFIQLGAEIKAYIDNCSQFKYIIDNAIREAELRNPWFIHKFTLHSLERNAYMLNEEQLKIFSDRNNLCKVSAHQKNIGLILPGNLPLVGFQDLAHVLLANHNVYAKLSKSDNILLPMLVKILVQLEPSLKNRVQFVTQLHNNIDAVIATGSNNTARYFAYFYATVPHIIRKNRNSIAILNGLETQMELEQLTDDLFLYFGQGCRNVSKIYVPQKYNWSKLINISEKYHFIKQHKSYYNNYLYNKSICSINQIPFIDGNFFLLKPSSAIQSPISVIHYEEYNDLSETEHSLTKHTDEIQCIISSCKEIKNAIPIGQAQQPTIDDYADGLDTIEFLRSI